MKNKVQTFSFRSHFRKVTILRITYNGVDVGLTYKKRGGTWTFSTDGNFYGEAKSSKEAVAQVVEYAKGLPRFKNS